MTATHAPLDARTLFVAKAGTKMAAMIYKYSVDSANSLWAAYDLARTSRGKPRGITTDQEQDILRAMLVSAGSGVDACLKRLVKDCVPRLVRTSDSVQEALEKFAQKHIQGGDSISGTVSPKALARLLAAPDPQEALVEQYVYSLTGDSLQSADQVLKVAAALGIDRSVLVDVTPLKKIFTTRNEIIHELDMNMDHPVRKRRVRKQADMQAATERLLKVSADFITDVDARISA
jgi:hypothetical protein